MARLIKICGVKTADIAIAASRVGADLIGFVFFRKSPRYIAPEAAEEIVTEVKWASEDNGFEMPRFVGLFVDAGAKLLAETAPFLSHFQFHGHEDAARCVEMSGDFGVEVIKALPVTSAADLNAAAKFEDAADLVLFDARPPKGADRPGGRGAAFDWSVLKHYRGATPFLLAGGLDAANVGAAAAMLTGLETFAGVDVSTSLESRPGKKDPDKVAAFVKAAKKAL